LVSPATLNAEDSRGRGPANSVRVGRDIVYHTVDPLNYLARQTGYRLVSMQSVCPAKSLGEEALDTLPALSRFVEAITDSSTRDHAAAHDAMQDAIREIEEAYEAYRTDERRDSPRLKR
jgi:hypothetical protein